jgi:hypothetical protein
MRMAQRYRRVRFGREEADAIAPIAAIPVADIVGRRLNTTKNEAQ